MKHNNCLTLSWLSPLRWYYKLKAYCMTRVMHTMYTSSMQYQAWVTYLNFQILLLILGMCYIAHRLDEGPDIKRAILEKCEKSYIVLSISLHVKIVLFSSHCPSFYGGILWDIICNQIKSLEITFNNILRHIWMSDRSYCNSAGEKLRECTT